MISVSDNESVSISNEENFSDYKEEPEDNIKYLKKRLLKNNIYNIYKTYLSNNNIMDTSKEKDNKKDEITEITEKYFEDNEEVSEVKINLFFILSKDFRLNNNSYIELVDENNNIGIQRLTIQKFKKFEDKIIFEPKEYSFISIHKYPIIFPYGKDNIEVIKNTMKYNDTQLLDEDNFVSNNNFAINKETDQLMSEEEFHKFKKAKKGSKSKSNDSVNTISTKREQSANETKGKTFYKVDEDNSYIRFIYAKYKKEIDGIYDHHQEIRMNEPKIVELKEGINALQTDYNNDNDLKGAIIYKNFEGDTIKEDEPVILEIKGGFNLIELLEQIKHISKIFKNYKGEIQAKTPKTVIGIMAQYYQGTCQLEMGRLNEDYKNTGISCFDHIADIIKKNDFNVVIAVINGGKISDYSLIEEDYLIKDYYQRVNLALMNEKIKLGKNKDELNQIIETYKKKYKSLTFFKSIKMDKHHEELDNKEKEIANKYQNLINDQNIQIKAQANQINVQANQINEQNIQINEQAREIEEKDKKINEQSDLIQSQQKELDELKRKIKSYQDNNFN